MAGKGMENKCEENLLRPYSTISLDGGTRTELGCSLDSAKKTDCAGHLFSDGTKLLAVRLGGIYALGCLAREHPRDYHRQIMNLLCSFVRNPPAVDEHDTVKKQDTNEVREDVHAVLPLICIRSKLQIEIEEKEFYFNLDLSGADLHGVSLLRVSSLGNSDMEPPLEQGAEKGPKNSVAFILWEFSLSRSVRSEPRYWPFGALSFAFPSPF